ncbi:hypothetical protein N7466_003158 [Penicillium verhagenii]|uniref:uncharacterized protein n=1 Tax=Penicillium verhagenii TaxID=1562060 RepID=UPI002545B226|nr:uncharacterized protein N7466_003158 [Penicillium verhagenii]KAJ5936708.1 hypothetical protein N7466_003158 [Penicillium verhagenii]
MSTTTEAGEKREGSPKENENTKRQAHMPSQSFYFKQTSDVPESLLQQEICKYIIEFLDTELQESYQLDANGKRSNHAVAKLFFKHPLKEDTRDAPANTLGLMIDLSVRNIGGVWFKRYVVSDLEIKTFTHAAHRLAVKTVEVPLNAAYPDMKANDFLQVLIDKQMLPCGFNTDGDAVGCRDFVSQLTFRLNEKGLLNITADNRQQIFGAFNANYGPEKDEARYAKTPYAAWNSAYTDRHHEIQEIEYRGDRVICDGSETEYTSTSATSSSKGSASMDTGTGSSGTNKASPSAGGNSSGAPSPSRSAGSASMDTGSESSGTPKAPRSASSGPSGAPSPSGSAGSTSMDTGSE